MCGENSMKGPATRRGGRRQRRRWSTIRLPTKQSGFRTTFLAVAFAIAVFGTHELLGSSCRSLAVVVTALTTGQRRAIIFSRIKRGMLLSQEAKHNITAAEEACGIWENVLSRTSDSSSSSSSLITQDVLSLSKTLYASCLVRVGRDAEAVSVYDSCLKNTQNNNNNTNFHSRHEAIKWRMAKARCLRRLLKYSDAAEEYSKVVEDATRHEDGNEDNNNRVIFEEQQARFEAATCILRSTGDVVRARKLLVAKASGSSAVLATPCDALLLSCCLEYLETGKDGPAVNQMEEVLSTIQESVISTEGGNSVKSSTSFLLYGWILAALKRKRYHDKPSEKESTSPPASEGETTTIATLDPKDLFMELIRINTSPLDDPDLLRLDDKIELHNLLATEKDRPTTPGKLSPLSYWPDGLILPTQSIEFKKNLRHRDDEESQLWIAKSRAGYGSHGNRILTLAEANEEINCAHDNVDEPAPNEPQKDTEPYLLQRMIDPLMLIQGYKFSLRIYVVYFSSDEAYISSKGLVKLASTPLLHDDERDEMTKTRASAVTLDENKTIRANATIAFRDPSMHMTNSGRESVMHQEDLGYLWSEFDSDGGKEQLWKDICEVAADTLLVRYSQQIANLDTNDPDRERKQVWKNRRESWGIPKILGLDFVVQEDASDNRKKPWLVEVNRFPGLEPRDEDDRKIKYRIVRDAWKKASERLAGPMDGAIFESLTRKDGGDETSSLERLRLQAMN